MEIVFIRLTCQFDSTQGQNSEGDNFLPIADNPWELDWDGESFFIVCETSQCFYVAGSLCTFPLLPDFFFLRGGGGTCLSMYHNERAVFL